MSKLWDNFWVKWTIPLTFDLCYSLEMLYLGGNLISSIPSEVANLNSLRYLVLCDNRIQSIPPQLNKWGLLLLILLLYVVKTKQWGDFLKCYYLISFLADYTPCSLSVSTITCWPSSLVRSSASSTCRSSVSVEILLLCASSRTWPTTLHHLWS